MQPFGGGLENATIRVGCTGEMGAKPDLHNRMVIRRRSGDVVSPSVPWRQRQTWIC